MRDSDNKCVIYLMVLAGLAAAYLVRVGFFAIRHRKEWKTVFAREKVIADFINLAFGFALNAIAALFILIFTGKATLYSSFLLFFVSEIFFLLVRPFDIILRYKKEGTIDRKRVIFAGLGTILLLLETFVFNCDSFRSFGEQTDIDFSVATISNAPHEENGYRTKTGSTIYFDLPVDARTVELDFDHPKNSTIQVVVGIRPEGETDFYDIATHYINGTYDYFDILGIGVQTAGTRVRLKFTFDAARFNADQTAVLTGIHLNSKLPFDPSFVRTAFLLTAAAIVVYAIPIANKIKAKSPSKLIYAGFAGVFVVTLAVVIAVVSGQKDAYSLSYPLTQAQLDTRQVDIFVRLFDAFKKGQFHLDATVSEAMANTAEPWVTPRNFGYYLWDHAYYNGKYYCYYGCLPVLLISFPFYWLSGRVPNAFALQLFGLPFLIPAFLFVIHELYLTFNKRKIHYPTYFVLCACACVLALSVALCTYKDGAYHEAVYHVPDVFGLAMADLFFGFVFLAYRSDKYRPIFMPFSGLFFVFIVMSRPSLVFLLAIAAPFYLSMLIRKKRTWKQKALDFLPMIAVLIAGAAFVCYYNYARFDSITEFGQSYQLTVADQRHLTYAADKFFPSIIHFFFNGPQFNKGFPYITASVMRLSFDNCPYVQNYLGIGLIPVFWLAIVLPFLFRKGDERELRWFGYIFPFLLILMAFTTYSKAGVCARYMIELYHVATLGSLAGIIVLANRFKKDEVIPHQYFYAISAVLVVSLFVTFSVAFDRFDGMAEGDMGGLLLHIRKIFGITNL